jgi:hypothetical protein
VRRVTDAHPSLRQSQLAGGVRKSFSLVAGIMLTGLLDVVVLDAEIKCVAQHGTGLCLSGPVPSALF